VFCLGCGLGLGGWGVGGVVLMVGGHGVGWFGVGLGWLVGGGGGVVMVDGGGVWGLLRLVVLVLVGWGGLGWGGGGWCLVRFGCVGGCGGSWWWGWGFGGFLVRGWVWGGGLWDAGVVSEWHGGEVGVVVG